MKTTLPTTLAPRLLRALLLFAACLLALALSGSALAQTVRQQVAKPAATPASAPANAPAAKKDFLVFDATLFKHKPSNLPELGFRPLPLIYEGEFWAPGVQRIEPDLARTRQAANRVAPLSSYACLDIECLQVFNKPPQEIQANMRRLASVADAVHAAQPKLKIGYYLLIPVRDYWTPVDNKPDSVRAWQQANDSLKDLVKHVDVIFPSLYTFYDDPEGWKIYAKANIMEAKRYGKPVYPFLWYQYHDSNKLLGGKPIPAQVWRMQLETCLQYADGVVIWGGHKELWNEQYAWWTETKAFLSRIGADKARK